MTKEDSPAQVSKPNKWNRNVNGEASRNGFQSPANSNSPPFRAGSSPNAPPSSRQDPPGGRRRSDSPSTAATTEHSFEAQPPPPRRPPGTFEYGHTYGSSLYRHDQTTFLGTPRLPTRYQPDHALYRQNNRHLNDSRRRQFSPFVHVPKCPEKSPKDETPEKQPVPRGQSTLSPDGPKNREFLVNHDWGDSSPTQEQPASIVYKTCALTVWHEDGIYGFLCDGNVLYNNLHFYANGATLVEEEEDKRLNELASDRLQCGHRVEIEAEFLEPDLSDREIHHLIYVRKILKIGTEQSLDLVRPDVLIPLTRKRAAPYYRALSESNDLVYIHPTILLKSVLIGAMKQRLVSCRPAYVENALDVLHSNRTISGKVTVAPRWIGDTIGRMCNLKRVLISCEPCGDTSQAYGTVVETIGDTSVVIQTHSRSDRVYCSLISACSDPNVSLKVGSHVRYTACPNLPNSTYKWRCVNISKSSWVDSDDSKNLYTTRANHAVASTTTGASKVIRF
ncbi:hypothetical protein Q1695_007798 [Nippostrongylus brasiliensis]|nr:hypothetical protein Q1695_007798 [Nippostrongylus brasiliensis]